MQDIIVILTRLKIIALATSETNFEGRFIFENKTERESEKWAREEEENVWEREKERFPLSCCLHTWLLLDCTFYNLIVTSTVSPPHTYRKKRTHRNQEEGSKNQNEEVEEREENFIP